MLLGSILSYRNCLDGKGNFHFKLSFIVIPLDLKLGLPILTQKVGERNIERLKFIDVVDSEIPSVECLAVLLSRAMRWKGSLNLCETLIPQTILILIQANEGKLTDMSMFGNCNAPGSFLSRGIPFFTESLWTDPCGNFQ